MWGGIRKLLCVNTWLDTCQYVSFLFVFILSESGSVSPDPFFQPQFQNRVGHFQISRSGCADQVFFNRPVINNLVKNLKKACGVSLEKSGPRFTSQP